MKKMCYIIAIIAFYIGAFFFFIDNNNVAGGLNVFSGTCFLIVYLRQYTKKV